GVALTVVEGPATRAVTSSGIDGVYRVALPAGAYELRAALTGFDPFTGPVALTGAPECSQTLDLTLTLTPRRAAAPAAGRGAGTPGAGRRGAATPFQRVDVQQAADEDASAEAPATATLDPTLLPPG